MRAVGCVRNVSVLFLVWLLLIVLIVVFTSFRLPAGGVDERQVQDGVAEALEQVKKLQSQNKELQAILTEIKSL